MSEQQNNNEKKTNEKCQCTKKIMALDKQVKELKTELEAQKRRIETLIKVLKGGRL
jgi:predicted RNase H-like nuclease (RuvC/YqgF family)